MYLKLRSFAALAALAAVSGNGHVREPMDAVLKANTSLEFK